MTELKNAAQAHENATQRLNGENRLLTEQNMTLAGAVSAAERAQRQAQELADKLKPLEASNRDLEAARDRLADLVDDLEAAAAAGDLALVQDLLHPSGDGPGLRV
jgi:DNA repair exonuclease SbcCD ATPase subunit